MAGSARERLDLVEVRLGALEAMASPEGDELRPEWFGDVLAAIVAALRQLRQQGAWNMANELELKYMSGPAEPAGDVVTSTGMLHSSGKEPSHVGEVEEAG